MKLRKPKKPAARQAPAWKIYRLKGTPAAFVGRVYAKDKAAALKAAIEQFKVRKVDQRRLFARPL